MNFSKLLSVLFLTFCFVSCGTKSNVAPSMVEERSPFEQIYPFALRGELQDVFSLLESMGDEELSPGELKQKERYYARFINESETYNYKIEDLVVIEFVDKFHAYWKAVMLDSLPISEADSSFVSTMSHFLFEEKYEQDGIPFDSIQQDLYKYSNAFLNDHGYFSNAFGRTGHLYDLFLWKKEDVVKYKIALVGDSVDVTVHLMDEFIATGWSHYATLGRSYAGGWANKEALFCVVSAYDLSSESFEVSYLTHEGQHFADYRNYPILKQRDLEYRAKLVELIKSRETTCEVIDKFLRNASENSNSAHAFANYCVLRDLYEAIYNKPYVMDEEDWHSCDPKIIRAKSLILFENHTAQLITLGRDTVTNLIK